MEAWILVDIVLCKGIKKEIKASNLITKDMIYSFH